MKLLLIFPSVVAIALHTNVSGTGGSVFDKKGHCTTYEYIDGKRIQYTYESSGKLIRFTRPDSETTVYVYNPDGTLRTVSPSEK